MYVLRTPVQPPGRPVLRTAVQPPGRPALRTAVQPPGRPVLRTAVQPPGRPVLRTAVQPPGRRVLRTAVQPPGRPVLRTAVQPPGRPVLRTAVHPTGACTAWCSAALLAGLYCSFPATVVLRTGPGHATLPRCLAVQRRNTAPALQQTVCPPTLRRAHTGHAHTEPRACT